MKAEVIVRRKAKRIQRASKRLSYIEQDIRLSKSIHKSEKEYLLTQIKHLKNYLINDDYEENQYNYDNKNG
ncbi:hypothetical protein D7X33_28075 [Butyricicoccus sp. 1XD8-22]|nr:hypothetical protein D7X33_28075 [Butyricicoccus sp. 1XD8-22]